MQMHQSEETNRRRTREGLEAEEAPEEAAEMPVEGATMIDLAMVERTLAKIVGTQMDRSMENVEERFKKVGEEQKKQDERLTSLETILSGWSRLMSFRSCSVMFNSGPAKRRTLLTCASNGLLGWAVQGAMVQTSELGMAVTTPGPRQV